MDKELTNRLLGEIPTPFYTFDLDVLKNRVEYLRGSLPQNVVLCYAMKANPFLVSEMDYIDKFEICSFGEYKICESMNVPKSKYVISGVYKDKPSMEYIVRDASEGQVFTIESVTQLELLNELGSTFNKVLNVILRLTSGNQFGMSEEDVFAILEKRAEYKCLNITGIQYFSTTQKQNQNRIKKELAYLDDFLDRVRNMYQFQVETLEFGGGFPVEYFETESDFIEKEYLEFVSNTIKGMNYQGKIVLELGRSIAGSCGKYYTRVVDAKTNSVGNFAILDGGMHQMIYYGQMMAMKKPKLEVLPPRESDDVKSWNLCGALCTINDIVVKNLEIANLKIGDVIVFKNTGAYAMTEGISLFLSRELPRVVFIKGQSIKLVRDNVPTYTMNMPNLERSK